jgi:acetyltransferase-like isoleucine patch superfamily enzyme
MAVGAGGGLGARLAALFAGEGPALVVRDGALRTVRAFTAAHAHELVESGTRVAIGAGASIGAGTRIELLGGGVSIGAGARIGEGVVIRPSGSVSIGAGSVVEDLAQLESDLAGGASLLSLGEGTRVARGTRLWAHRAPLAVGAACDIGASNTWIATGRGISVAERCDFTHAVTLDSADGSISIAAGSGVGPNSILYGHGGLAVGAGCAIAGLVMIVPANHRFARLDQPIRAQGSELLPISIGDDVWIAGGAVVLGGATIGDGAVVGAGAVVRGVVRARAIVAGVPAREIGRRDDAEFR